MTPQQAYEKRYADISRNQLTWEAAPPHVKDLWLAAWTIAWAMSQTIEREACAKECDIQASFGNDDERFGARQCAHAIRTRG